MEVNGTEILGRVMPKDETYQVKVYDFKRPDKFSKEQIRSLSIIHETCARIAKASLSANRLGRGFRFDRLDLLSAHVQDAARVGQIDCGNNKVKMGRR